MRKEDIQWNQPVTVRVELEITKANEVCKYTENTRTRHKYRSHSDPSAINHL